MMKDDDIWNGPSIRMSPYYRLSEPGQKKAPALSQEKIAVVVLGVLFFLLFLYLLS